MMSGVGGVGARAGAGAVGAEGAERAERARLLWSTLLFVAGFSLVFAVLEATASALSHPLQAHKLVLSDVAGALIVAMGVLIAFQLPWLQREHRFAVRPSRLGPWAAPVMGMTFAFGWTPCITPVLAAVLGLASSGGPLARGGEMLVAFSFGLGVPFVLTGLAFGRLSGALGFARRHSRAVSLVSGALLAALGVLIITGEVGVVSSWSNSLLDHIGLGGLASG
jgi:cytochrome c-type biogenesis protein